MKKPEKVENQFLSQARVPDDKKLTVAELNESELEQVNGGAISPVSRFTAIAETACDAASKDAAKL